MQLAFRYRSEQIREIVAAEKRLRNPQSIVPDRPLPFKTYGQNGRKIDLDLDMEEGPLLNLRFHVRAGVVNDPMSYVAAIFLDTERIRGVDYARIEQKRWFKISIPQGWHQNLVDPNVDGRDGNRHEALTDFNPTDLDGFFFLTARLWRISIPRGGQLL